MVGDRKLPSSAGANEVDAFVREVGKLPTTAKPGGRGRLLFAMDATASREPTWITPAPSRARCSSPPMRWAVSMRGSPSIAASTNSR